MFLVGLSWVLWFVLNLFCFGLDVSDEIGKKMPNFCFQPDASSPRRRSARVGEALHLGEGLFAYTKVYSFMQTRDLYFGHFLLLLGEGMLRLSKPLH